MNRFKERRWDYRAFKCSFYPNGYNDWTAELILTLAASVEFIAFVAWDVAVFLTAGVQELLPAHVSTNWE
jgi:hypothetical protein